MAPELLSPARDAHTAREAILAGADSVYIGAPLFGARKDAANSAATSQTCAVSRTSTAARCTSP